MTPFFSIIIPTLNEESYLPKLLQSLLKQSSKDFEVIVVDGMSEDKTIEKAEAFRVRFEKRNIPFHISSVSKRNVSFQRNFGAELAKGSYFIFFDADVQIEKNYLPHIKKHIAEKESLFMTSWLLPDRKEIIDELFVYLSNLGIEIALNTPRPLLPGHNVIIERNAFASVGGFILDFKHSEDFYFAYTARKKGIQLRYVRDAVQTVSLRRLRHEGHMNVLKNYSRAFIDYVLYGITSHELYTYEQGGHVHIRDTANKPFFSFITPRTFNRKHAINPLKKITAALEEILNIINGKQGQ